MSEEKTTVVNTGSGAGMAMFAVVIVIALVLLAIFFGPRLLNGNQPINADVKIETPAKS
jgi:hypothetical protein